MKQSRTYLVSLVAMLVVAACTTSGSGGEDMEDTGLIGQWEFEMIADTDGTLVPPVDGTYPFVVFSPDTYAANSGCNQTGGSVTIGDDGAFDAEPGMSTLIGCPEVLAQQEANMTRALTDASSWTVAGDTAVLKRGTDEVAQLRRIDTTLASSHWFVNGINNGKGGVQSIVADSEPTLWFQTDGRLSGTTGCNDINASYEIGSDPFGQGLSIENVGMTRKLCSPELMEQERWMTAALEAAYSYRIFGDQLRITDEDGATLITGHRLPLPIP